MLKSLAKIHAINPNVLEITDDTGKRYGEKSQLAMDMKSLITTMLEAWPESIADPKLDERYTINVYFN